MIGRFPRRLLLALVAAHLSLAAQASHEANHRYTIRGYILDSPDRPLAAIPISVRVGARRLGGGRTDSRGFYSVELHIHDSDIGRDLELRAGDRRANIRMKAQRGDRTSARLHYANFIGDRFTEEKFRRWYVPVWGYGAAGAGLLVVTALTARRLHRKRRAASNGPTRRGSSGRRRKKGKKPNDFNQGGWNVDDRHEREKV